MAFSFGFSGDDIEGRDVDAAAGHVEALSLAENIDNKKTTRVQRHSLTDLVSGLTFSWWMRETCGCMILCIRCIHVIVPCEKEYFNTSRA